MVANKDVNPRHLDQRVMDRYVRKGLVSQQDVDQHLAGLADAEGNAEYMPIPDPGAARAEGDDDDTEADA